MNCVTQIVSGKGADWDKNGSKRPNRAQFGGFHLARVNSRC